MNNRRKLAVRFLMILALFPISIMISEIYYGYQQVDSLYTRETSTINQIENRKWDMIENTIEENNQKAKIQANAIRDKMIYDIESAYGTNMSRLKSDLDSNNDSQVLTIFNNDIKNKYLNKDSDNNRVFVADKNGIIADRGLASSVKESREWQSEIDSKINNKLASKAVSMILMKDNRIIYWTADNIDDISTIGEELYPSISSIKDSYKANGLDALKNYNILVPAYITDDGDIFGVPDVDNHGLKISNHKLFIVQEYNIYDAINAHNDDLMKYNEDIQNVRESTKGNIDSTVQSYVIIIILTLFSTIAMLYGANLIIKWGGDDDSID